MCDMTQLDRCRIFHKVLHLLVSTVAVNDQYRIDTPAACTVTVDGEEVFQSENIKADFVFDLHAQFALPPPVRDSLLSTALSLIMRKDMLRSISRTAIDLGKDEDPNNSQEEREGKVELIIHWKVLLGMLLRTAPYLDENESSSPPTMTNGKYNSCIKRTAQLIKASRRYFAHGEEIGVWDMVKDDLLHSSHTNKCFRAQIMLYLFLPSQCPPEFYGRVLPLWLE